MWHIGQLRTSNYGDYSDLTMKSDTGHCPVDSSVEEEGIISSDRSSCRDDGLLYVHLPIYPQQPLFQIFTQSIDAIDVTSVTRSRLNSINVIDVTRC